MATLAVVPNPNPNANPNPNPDPNPNQVWCTQMHSKSVVGLANATSAGWGNMGGGVTNLVMPFVFSAIYNLLEGSSLEREDKAWRYA